MSGEKKTVGSAHIRPDMVLLLHCVVILVASCLALLHQTGGFGALGSPGTLLAELNATSLENPWGLGEQLPYRYRPLFRWLVLLVWERMEQDPEQFFLLFVGASTLSLILAAFAFRWLLRTLGFSGNEALAGVMLFLLGFPVVFSHNQPIHTREDFLGYAWICLTLVAVVKDRPLAVAFLGCVGVCIRETCLLGVLPYFLVSQRSWGWRVAAYGIPGVVLLALRIIRGQGQSSYDYVGISIAPALAAPGEAVLYAWASFGVVWVLGAFWLFRHKIPRHPLLRRAPVILAVLATIGSGWTMGMIRENRITYILFPFLIPLVLDFASTEMPGRLLRSRVGQLAGFTVILLYAGLFYWLKLDPVGHGSQLADWIGPTFNPGVVPVEIREIQGHQAQIYRTHASLLNGPHVAIHLALSAWVLAGLISLRIRSASRELQDVH